MKKGVFIATRIFLFQKVLDVLTRPGLAPLHNLDLHIRQPEQLIHQPIDLLVNGLNLALQRLFLLQRVGTLLL
jgi:hypothetical protein